MASLHTLPTETDNFGARVGYIISLALWGIIVQAVYLVLIPTVTEIRRRYGSSVGAPGVIFLISFAYNFRLVVRSPSQKKAETLSEFSTPKLEAHHFDILYDPFF